MDDSSNRLAITVTLEYYELSVAAKQNRRLSKVGVIWRYNRLMSRITTAGFAVRGCRAAVISTRCRLCHNVVGRIHQPEPTADAANDASSPESQKCLGREIKWQLAVFDRFPRPPKSRPAADFVADATS